MRLSRLVGGATVALGAVAVRDLLQKRHALQRNLPVIGHARYLLETIGPELRQYIVTSNEEERPFSRDQRSWIYASAKAENNYFGFGTDVDVEHVQGHAYIKQPRSPRSCPTTTTRRRGCPAPRCSAVRAGGPRRSARARW